MDYSFEERREQQRQQQQQHHRDQYKLLINHSDRRIVSKHGHQLEAPVSVDWAGASASATAAAAAHKRSHSEDRLKEG